MNFYKYVPTLRKWGLEFPTSTGLFTAIGFAFGVVFGVALLVLLVEDEISPKSCTEYYMPHKDVTINGEKYILKGREDD